MTRFAWWPFMLCTVLPLYLLGPKLQPDSPSMPRMHRTGRYSPNVHEPKDHSDTRQVTKSLHVQVMSRMLYVARVPDSAETMEMSKAVKSIGKMPPWRWMAMCRCDSSPV